MNVATFQDIKNVVDYLIPRCDINTPLGAVVHLLYRCGLRVEEACELKRFTILPTTFTVDTEKKSLDRTFDLGLLPSAYYPALSSPPPLPVLWVLSSTSSVTRFILQNSPQIFYKDTKRITTNLFRYYYVRNLQDQGYTVEQIQVIMGHSNISSTLSYLSPIYYK